MELKLVQTEGAMSWMDFVASLVESLAWPVAAFAIALVFRKQLLTLLENLEEFGWGEARAKFSKRIDKAEQVAESLPTPLNAPALPASPTEEDRFEQLLAISPSAAVLDAWNPIEISLRKVAEKHGVPSSRYVNPAGWVKELNKAGFLPMSVVTLVNELRKVRNVAAHSDEVTVSDALRFRELSGRVKGVLAVYEDVPTG